MKKLLIASAILLTMAFGVSNSAKAQITGTDVIAAAGNLVNVQVGNIDVNAVDVIDVTNVLNNNDVQILSNILNNLTIDNVLNNLLRDANVITGNQVVVGVIVNVLGGVTTYTFYVADRALFGNKKPKK
ncbi:MAG: hypothetical protein M3342_08290 [Bacteroidota bacterium]|nr:hypothetical protein [Bacteroidota bacterium]